MAIGKPTREPRFPEVSNSPKPPMWYGGSRWIWNKQWGSGAKHSGPSGRRAGRYHPPVARHKTPA